jgi:hypothetical protein
MAPDSIAALFAITLLGILWRRRDRLALSLHNIFLLGPPPPEGPTMDLAATRTLITFSH